MPEPSIDSVIHSRQKLVRCLKQSLDVLDCTNAIDKTFVLIVFFRSNHIRFICVFYVFYLLYLNKLVELCCVAIGWREEMFG